MAHLEEEALAQLKLLDALTALDALVIDHAGAACMQRARRWVSASSLYYECAYTRFDGASASLGQWAILIIIIIGFCGERGAYISYHSGLR